MVEWHHVLSGQCEQTLGDYEGQGSLCAIVHGVSKSWTQLRDWTTITETGLQFFIELSYWYI